MATRRAHNKSRLGCHQCKKRRIKCDGKQPTCANCDKKFITCSFLMLAPSSSLSVAATSNISPQLPPYSTSPVSSHNSSSPISFSPETTSVQSSDGSSPSSYSISSNEGAITTIIPRNVGLPFEEPISDFLTTINPSLFKPVQFPEISIPRQLRLDDAWKDVRQDLSPSLQEVLQHYEYTTSLTLANDDPAKAAWQSGIPEMARKHDFLVNCVLSVASLHLGRLHEDATQKKRMNAVAAARMNIALIKYRPELEKISKENAAALFASSTLTAVYLFRTSALDIEQLCASIPPHTITPPPDIVDKMMACVLRTIWGLRGPLAVLMGGWDWVVGGKMHPVAARKWWPKDRIPATPRAVDEDERLKQIERLWLDSEDSDKSWGPKSTHLNEALLFLREAFALVSQLTLPDTFRPMTSVPYSIDSTTIGRLTDRGAIFVWATRINRDFISLIEKKDRDALVLLAHYAILPGRVRYVWWLEGLGVDFLISIAMALGRENWHLIAWPASVLGVDLDNAFGKRIDHLEGLPDEMHMEVI